MLEKYYLFKSFLRPLGWHGFTKGKLCVTALMASHDETTGLVMRESSECCCAGSVKPSWRVVEHWNELHRAARLWSLRPWRYPELQLDTV